VTARSRERGNRTGRPHSTHGLSFTVPGRNRTGMRTSEPATTEPAATEPVQTQQVMPPTSSAMPAEGTSPAESAWGPPPEGTWSAAGMWPAAATSPAEGSRPAEETTGRSVKPPKKEKPKTAKRKLPKHTKMVVSVVVVAGALGAGFTDGGFGSSGAAEPTVSAFLYDWQTADYAGAAALTDGPVSAVRAQLAAAYTDLDASDELFAMNSITQHGGTAIATYTATVDLAEIGQQWSYTGEFRLTSEQSHWVVDWAPSVINPALGPGDRLAVQTSYAPRASILGVGGQSLLTKATDYEIGVYPGKLVHGTDTANMFAGITGVNAQQVLGQLQAAPPLSFLSLLTLSPSQFAAMWPKLSKVPGLTYTAQQQRLFDSSAQGIVGTVGTEDSAQLINDGVAYVPGMTVGLSGYEATYQNQLIGTPSTTVEVVDAAGRVTKRWAVKGGQAGKPVQTTLDLTAQTAAANALAAQPNSGEIVAVDTTTGAIRADDTDAAGSLPLPANGPLAGQIQPGMAFSIVSAAALLSSGVTITEPLPCVPVTSVGGQNFSYTAAAMSTTATFASDFANGCGTAFANLSRNLSAQQLAAAEKGFGIGASWTLPQSFSGSAPVLSDTDEGGLAAQATGGGGILMSPLGMAIVAAEVASGSGHSPSLLAGDPPSSWAAPVSGTELTELQQLMRLTVEKGTAQAANLPGAPVYGQAGIVQTGKTYLSWFVGYRGTLAVAALETGKTPEQAAAGLAAQFLKTATN
jgi:cell division protein FtsI/penicillin-binding protein 2